MTDDAELLRRYARDRVEDAFAELVRRHLNMVYAAALRQVRGDTHLAEDVAQRVFTDMARKASSLQFPPSITGWLYTSTRYAAANAVRAEQRRKAREQEHERINASLYDSEPGPDWERCRMVLDEAMHRLKARDREVLLLRYFEGCRLSQVGAKLGLNENTARMRVERALEKLRGMLARRGITSSSAALAGLLAAEGAAAAPAGMAATVTSASLSGAAIGSGTGLLFLKLIAMTKLKIGLVSGVIGAGLVASVVVQQQSLSRLREQNAQLREQNRQLAELAEQNNSSTSGQVAADEASRIQRERAELMKLRGEVSALRRDASAAAASTKAAEQAKANTESRQADSNPNEPTKFQANVRVQVQNGQTLVTGGWLSSDGKRTLVFATPQAQGSDGTVLIRTKFLEVSEPVLSVLGLDNLRVDGADSSLKELLPAERAKAVVDALQNSGEISMREAAVMTADGRQAQISMSMNEGTDGGDSMISFTPSISPGGGGVDLALGVEMPRPTASRH
jgi:RNA polymerase sigma factor (sigma-70 family)